MQSITKRPNCWSVRGPCGSVTWLVLLVLVPLTAGCSSPEERAAYHLERGREFAAAGKVRAAKIELRSVLTLEPDNLAANLDLAGFADAEGNLQALKFYLRGAFAADPDSDEVAIRLATLLREDRPWRARQLLLEVLARNPTNAIAHIGLSQFELSIGNRSQALASAERAIAIAPDLAGGYWQLGIAYEAILEQSTRERLPIDETVRRAAVEAFEGFITSGGEPQWKARIEQARILATGAHNRDDALASAQRALDSARAAEDDRAKAIAAGHLANVARIQRNRAAYADAIEVLLEVTPRDFYAWRNLAELREASGGSAEAVYQKLLSQFPYEAEAHVLYARHLGNAKSVWVALRYFEDQIGLDIEPAQLLSALRSYQLTYHLKAQAAGTLAKMRKDYPDDPWTQLELAKVAVADGRPLEAIASLKALTQDNKLSEAFEILAKLELFRHRPKKAIPSARTAVDTKGYYDEKLYRLLADSLIAGHEFAEYLEALDVIERHEELTPGDQLAKARALYETEDNDAGREILLALIEEPSTSLAATLEFARRESSDTGKHRLARKFLRSAIARHPDNRELVLAQIDLDVQSGRPDAALRTLDALDVTKYSANVRYLRARLRTDSGNSAGAMLDINQALRADPMLPGLLDFAFLLYSKDGNTAQHVRRIENWVRVMRADTRIKRRTNSLRISQLHLLHSRLLLVKGRSAEAIAVLESAISNQEYSVDTQVDLAFLLASTGTDVDRAVEIASEAITEQASNPRALDILGYSHLRADEPLEALRNFRLANRKSTTPNPLFHFHESAALRELGRNAEALKAIETVLALDPDFPQAAEARQSLLSSMTDPPQAS